MTDVSAFPLQGAGPGTRTGARERGRFLALLPALPPGLIILLLFVVPMLIMTAI